MTNILFLDLETTGLDPVKNDIIQLGVIYVQVDNGAIHKKGEAEWLVQPSNQADWNHQALTMNLDILSRIMSSNNNAIEQQDISGVLYNWLVQNGCRKSTDDRISLVLAGKNVMNFDYPFLKSLSNWSNYFKVLSRHLDPTSLYYSPFEDQYLPDLKTCMEKAGFEETDVKHTALSDARKVYNLFLHYWNSKLK